MRASGPFPAIVLLVCGAVLAAFAGCADKNVRINARSDGRDVFEDPVQRPGVSMSGADLSSYAARPPFIDLSTYDWDYADWLDDLSTAVAGLRLPGSKDARVTLLFTPGAARPEADVECGGVRPADCDLLHEQVESLGTLPRLPKGFPFAELTVRLSRLP